jgi:hypothetical protein
MCVGFRSGRKKLVLIVGYSDALININMDCEKSGLRKLTWTTENVLCKILVVPLKMH